MSSQQARGGAVASSGHPQATDAAVRMLQQGGNAVDAALAAAFCQWVVMGPHCGPGGELVLLHAAADGTVRCYAGWSRTPHRLAATSALPANGTHAAAVPGALRGAQLAHSAAGSRAWADLFAPALEAAAGHRCSAAMAREYRTVVDRGHGAALHAVLGVAEPPVAGDTVRADALGSTLARIAHEGADTFYTGTLAAELLQAAAGADGWLGADDLAGMAAEAVAVPPVGVEGAQLFLTPPPSQASIVAELAAAVDAGEHPTSRAFAERQAPLTQRRLVERCTVGLAGTATCLAADADGAAAVVVHSLAGTQFGSGWVAGDTGVAFSNRVGTALSTRADLPGAHPRPGEPMTHTLSAVHVRTADGRAVTMATPGGDRQVQWLAQAVQGVRLGLAPAEVVALPRWFVCPEGNRFGVPAGIGSPWYVFGEPGVAWYDDAECAGYPVRRMASVGGNLQVVERRDGGWVAASDPRADGGAQALPAARAVPA